MTKVKHTLHRLYQTHGALTFALAFLPIMPGVIEVHTKGYLAITRALTGSVTHLDEAIKVIFGQRGLTAYHDYIQSHPTQILPEHIFTAFSHADPSAGLKLVNDLFFDPRQRLHPHADKFRAAVILTSPDILDMFPTEKFQAFRSQFIASLAKQTISDKSLTAQIAYIDAATHLLTQNNDRKTAQQKAQLDQIFASLESKIKAELAGKASAFTAPAIKHRPTRDLHILLTPEDEHNLNEVLLLLALNPAPEIANHAQHTLKALNDIPAH